jgi:hypothetical protein
MPFWRTIYDVETAVNQNDHREDKELLVEALGEIPTPVQMRERVQGPSRSKISHPLC